MFRPIPADLYRTVEPEAGEVLPVSRYRRSEEFHPNWAHICSPAATVDAVVAALLQSADDVPDRIWERALQVHCPDAWALLTGNGWTWGQFNRGDVPAMSPTPNRIRNLINAELGGWAVVRCFPVADIAHAIESTLGALPEFR